MDSQGKFRYNLKEAESLTDDRSAIADSAVLEVTPTSNGNENIIEIAAVAKLPTGREKTVLGQLDKETAQDLGDDFEQILQNY